MVIYYQPQQIWWQEFLKYLEQADGWGYDLKEHQSLLNHSQWLPHQLQVYLTPAKSWFGRGREWQFNFQIEPEINRKLEVLSSKNLFDVLENLRGGFYQQLLEQIHLYFMEILKTDILAEAVWHNDLNNSLRRAEKIINEPSAQAKISEDIFWLKLDTLQKYLLNFYWRLCYEVAELQRVRKELEMSEWLVRLEHWAKLKDDYTKRHLDISHYDSLAKQFQTRSDFFAKGGRVNLEQNFLKEVEKNHHFRS